MDYPDRATLESVGKADYSIDFKVFDECIGADFTQIGVDNLIYYVKHGDVTQYPLTTLYPGSTAPNDPYQSTTSSGDRYLIEQGILANETIYLIKTDYYVDYGSGLQTHNHCGIVVYEMLWWD